MSKLNVAKVPSAEDRTLPVFAEFESMLDRLRDRAYGMFCTRGGEEGHALDDWLAAERELGWPAAELAEQDDEFELKLALPGFEPREIKVTATPRELIIQAAHLVRKTSESDGNHGTIHWSQIQRNDVFRRVELPADVNVEAVSAEIRSGVLTIEAPKASATGKKRKPVKPAPTA